MQQAAARGGDTYTNSEAYRHFEAMGAESDCVFSCSTSDNFNCSGKEEEAAIEKSTHSLMNVCVCLYVHTYSYI